MMQQQQGRGFLSSIPPIVKNLLIINILVFIAAQLFQSFILEYFCLYYPASPAFKPIQFFTYMFTHIDIWHIFFNMYALWMFGSMLEQYWGPKRFLIYYLITGLGSAVFYLVVQWIQLMYLEPQFDPATLAEMKQTLAQGFVYTQGTAEQMKWFSIVASPMLGASGAVFGLLLAFGMLFPNIKLQLLFPPVVLKAKWFVAIYGLIELGLGFGQIKGDNIAHFAHVGGMLFGIILILLWRKKGDNRYRQY